MKKIIALVLSLVLALAFAGCSGSPKIEIKTADDLVGKKIGVQLGTTGDLYASDIEGATIEQYSKTYEAIQSLKQGKIDAVIIDNEPAKAFVAENSDLQILDEPFTSEDYALAISKDKSVLKDQLNGAIAEVMTNGTLDAIVDKYINGVEGAPGYSSPADIKYPNGKLTMATSADFPPYEYYEGDAIVGFDTEFLKAVCDNLGYELVIEDMAFDSIILAVQSGKADFGAAGLTVNEERLQMVDFTDSYYTGYQSIIIKK